MPSSPRVHAPAGRPEEPLHGLGPQGDSLSAFATPFALSTFLLWVSHMKSSRLVARTGDLTVASPSVLAIEAVDRMLITKVFTPALSVDEAQLRRMSAQSNRLLESHAGTEGRGVRAGFWPCGATGGCR